MSLLPKICAKEKKLSQFLEVYKHLPSQGTPAWLSMRNMTIGGSEFYNLIHSPASLIANKIGMTSIPDMLPMKWGTLFESVIRTVMSVTLVTEIHEASSIPSAEVVGKSFSVDGLGVVSFLCDRWNDKPHHFRMRLLALFEFKCLYSREIKPGVVFPAYLPQVLSGMSDIPVVDVALYTEAVFRICEFGMLGNNPDCIEWLQKNPNPKRYCPMTYGFVGFYMRHAEIPEDDREAEILLEWAASGGEQDFAKLGAWYLLNRLLKYVKQGIVSVWYSQQTFQSTELRRCPWFERQQIQTPDIEIDMDSELATFQRLTRRRRWLPLGVLGYKLLDVNVVTVEKQPGYTKQYAGLINDALQKIQRLKNVVEDADRRREYYRLFPHVKPDVHQEDDDADNGADEAMLADLANLAM